MHSADAEVAARFCGHSTLAPKKSVRWRALDENCLAGRVASACLRACYLLIIGKYCWNMRTTTDGRTHRGAWPKFVRVSKFTVLGAQTSAKFSCLLIILNMIIAFSVAGGRESSGESGTIEGCCSGFFFVDHVCFDVDYSTNKTMHVVYMLLNGNNKQLGHYCL